MIRPLKPSENASGTFTVCDIENYPDGSLLTIDTAWREDGGGIEHTTYYDWHDWFRWVSNKAIHDKRFRRIYAHNGGGWDWLSLAEWMLRNKTDCRMSIASACSRMIALRVHINKKCTIWLCDSVQLLRSSLDTLAKKFLGYGKVDLKGKLPHEVYQQNPEKFMEYVHRDTETLLLVLEKALKLIRDRVAKIDTLGVTIGSTALKVFRTIGIDKPISIPTDNRVKSFLRKAYKGGRVEVFRYGYYPRINVYDVNSLYPYIMKTCKVPISSRGFWTDKYIPDTCGAYEIEFYQSRKDIPPVFMIDGDGVYEGRGYYFAPEIRTLLKYDPLATINVIRGYCFIDSATLFASFVDRLYNLRLEDRDGPVSLLAKYLLNSCYGKFGQHSEKETVEYGLGTEDIEAMVSKGIPVRPISIDSGVFGVTRSLECSFEHVGIAGTITAEARAYLYGTMAQLPRASIVYCDTDSIHTIASIDNGLVGEKLGQYKQEFGGEGVYVAKKVYALRCGRDQKIRCKGVSVGGKFGSRLSFDDILEISKGKEITCQFQKPTTIVGVLKGQKSCVFSNRVRTIRKV